jgi:hypothetical protein
MSTFTPTNHSNRIETNTHRIHLEPRISAAKLAEYVVANPLRQSAIVKNAKNAPKQITSQYHRVRNTFQHAHSEQGLSSAYFMDLALVVESAEADTDWQIRDNDLSGKALKKLAELASQVECASASIIHSKWKPLLIHGVMVSVHPEIVFSMLHKGITKVGGVILNTPLNESSSLAKSSGKHCVGDYLTALLYLMLANQAADVGIPLHTRCYAVDIFRDKIYTAPASYKTLVKHMDEACKMIALRWDSVPVEMDPESVDIF